MKLEKVTAEIRPRGRWESIDLGCALVRENYGKVMAAWFTTVVPIWLIIIACCQFWPWAEGRPWVAGFLCIWLLPIFDRVPLFVVSRRLFGENSTWIELLRALPGMFCRRLFMSLLLGPFAIGRGLAQPVMELEGLKGKAYRERVNLLSRNGGEGASQASFIGLILVLCTIVSLLFVFLGVVGLFGDSIVLEEFWVDYVLSSNADFMPVPYVWVLVALTLASITLIEPFYVGAGFAMYINSRTITEGWDIELAFKRMNDRVSGILQQTGKSLLVPVVLMLSLFSALDTTLASNSRLDEVMQHEDFVVHSEIVDVPASQSGGNYGADSAGMFGAFAQLFFWLVIVAVVVGIIWLTVRNRHIFSVNRSKGVGDKKSPVRSVMGMEFDPQSLPEDVVAAARQAWDARDHQLALSLLYRGSLSWLLNEAELSISESDTELDCVQRTNSSTQSDEIKLYFSTLTNRWMALAYGKMEPEIDDVSWLFRAWPFANKLERNDS